MQLSAGARGLTLAKTSEAEVFADLGIDDVFLAYPVVGDDKARRLLALSDRMRLTVGADSLAGARSLGGAFAGRGPPPEGAAEDRLRASTGSAWLRRHAVETPRRGSPRRPGSSSSASSRTGVRATPAGLPQDVARIGAEESRLVAETAAALARGRPVRRGGLPRLDAHGRRRDDRARRHRVPSRNLRLQRPFPAGPRKRLPRGRLRHDDARHGRQRAGAGPRRPRRRLEDAVVGPAAARGRRLRHRRRPPDPRRARVRRARRPRGRAGRDVPGRRAGARRSPTTPAP